MHAALKFKRSIPVSGPGPANLQVGASEYRPAPLLGGMASRLPPLNFARSSGVTTLDRAKFESDRLLREHERFFGPAR